MFISFKKKNFSDFIKEKLMIDIEKMNDSEKRKYIQESIEKQTRENQRGRSSNIFDYYSPSIYYTYGTYSLGYDQGVSNYISSQSTSSSTTGYGGSGGGFSGAGSSTSF